MKEIIIDGVNVAGCKYYHYKGCTANNLCKCGNSINCYFKQLKRAEIEIKKLKGVDGSVHPDSAYYKIARLEQENAELKEELEKTNEEAEYFINGDYCDEKCETAKKYCQKTLTLNAIKEIAENGTKTEDYLLGQRYTDLIDRILDLITNAEVGE